MKKYIIIAAAALVAAAACSKVENTKSLTIPLLPGQMAIRLPLLMKVTSSSLLSLGSMPMALRLVLLL